MTSFGVVSSPRFAAITDEVIWAKKFAQGKSSTLFISALWWDIHVVVRNVKVSHDDCITYLPSTHCKSLLVRWTPPPMDSAKLNVDGSLMEDKNVMGCRGLIRTDEGNWIVGFSSYDSADDALLAELQVVEHGLNLA